MENYNKNDNKANFKKIGENFYFIGNIYPVNNNRSHRLNHFTFVELR